MIEGMLYILRVACPWRDLPPYFGPWSSVYTRWRRWNRSGLWALLLKLLSAEAEGALVHLDATHVKAHQDSTNPSGGQASQAIGRTRGGLNTKVTALVDSKGRALQLVVDSGNQADIRCADRIEIPSGYRLVADKGYDSTNLRERIWDAGSCPRIPNLKNRKKPARWHRGYYKLRHRVENFFQRIKRLRRVGTRYEKLSLHFLGFVQLAAILDWIKSNI
jgi:transposase